MHLESLVTNKFRGIVTFSDVHAHAKKLKKGIRYAIKNDLFIVFLGDLVDGHNKPLETVVTVKALLDEDRAALVIGNHDEKFYRYAKGNPVIIKKANEQTLADVGKKNLPLFLNTMIGIVEHRNAKHHWKYGNWMFTHGACSKEVWQSDIEHPAKIQQKIKHKAMYGEVNGERDKDDFPIRQYRWVEHIPAGQGVVVGHDRKPMGVGDLRDTGPLDHTNKVGGRVIFTDTGCGKGGHLTLTTFLIQNEELVFMGYNKI